VSLTTAVRRGFPCAAALALAACSANAAGGGGVPARAASARSQAPAPPATPRIRHVVVLVQENRSFDNLFQGYPGADTSPTGKTSKGKTVKLKPVSLAANYDILHESAEYFQACDGTGSIPGTNCRMDGFDLETATGMKLPPDPQYAYVPHSETKLYFEMARRYVLADRMFTSHIDASFVSHQYIIAGQAQSAVDLPSGNWGCGNGPTDQVGTIEQNRTYGSSVEPCFDSQTIGDELDAKLLPWRFYANTQTDLWSGYQAISHVRNGPDWQNVIAPSAQFITDVGNGQLSAVTWITPSCANSDHPNCLSKTGPQWIASVVDAVGKSPFWDSTAIFVMWDEWGGWYDHVPPPYEDYDGLGFRVPLLVISPYAKQNYVSHVQYEHGSILRFIEDTFGLARLAASDQRATSPAADCFDFAAPPRAFVPF